MVYLPQLFDGFVGGLLVFIAVEAFGAFAEGTAFLAIAVALAVLFEAFALLAVASAGLGL